MTDTLPGLYLEPIMAVSCAGCVQVKALWKAVETSAVPSCRFYPASDVGRSTNDSVLACPSVDPPGVNSCHTKMHVPGLSLRLAWAMRQCIWGQGWATHDYQPCRSEDQPVLGTGAFPLATSLVLLSAYVSLAHSSASSRSSLQRCTHRDIRGRARPSEGSQGQSVDT